jgi:copper chaperone CopZ
MVRVYRVFGITCEDCKRAIETELKNVAGVRTAEVDVARRTVRVGGSAPEDIVRAAISAAGYGVADIVTG